jgi:hypothetical protein
MFEWLKTYVVLLVHTRILQCTTSIFIPQDRGSKFLQDNDTHPLHYKYQEVHDQGMNEFY